MKLERLQTEKLLGRGLTSEVFTWGDDRVLKLFLPGVETHKARREFEISQAVHGIGVPIPAAFELVQIGQRHGIAFERLRGHSLLKLVESKPWRLFAGARQLAELHARIHRYSAPARLPSQEEQLERWINGAVDFTEAEKTNARTRVADLRAGEVLCHGDFHPGNIILTDNGPKIIDWSAATRGHALADVARTSVLFENAGLPVETPLHIKLLMKVARRLLHRTYLKSYLQFNPGTLDEVEFWRLPQRFMGSAWRAEQRAAQARAEAGAAPPAMAKGS
jgi:uncharacterized protein (TIGR02172 family)